MPQLLQGEVGEEAEDRMDERHSSGVANNEADNEADLSREAVANQPLVVKATLPVLVEEEAEQRRISCSVWMKLLIVS